MVDRIAAPGADAWSIQMEAARLRDQGRDVIFLTVGDPDQAPPEPVIDATIDALRRHRTGTPRSSAIPESARRLPHGFSGAPNVRAAPTTSSSRPAHRAGCTARCSVSPA